MNKSPLDYSADEQKQNDILSIRVSGIPQPTVNDVLQTKWHM